MRYFITGTDTGVGKTYFSCHWLQQARANGLQVAAIKPVGTGGARNDDALLLQQHSNVLLPYALVNPFCFTTAAAPNIAAAIQGTSLNAQEIVQTCQPALQLAVDLLLVEGVGGWHCPINTTETMADVAARLQLPVIVVAIKLGCINHTLLSYQAIVASGVRFAGWVANVTDTEMPLVHENIATLTDCLGQDPILTLVKKTSDF